MTLATQLIDTTSQLPGPLLARSNPLVAPAPASAFTTQPAQASAVGILTLTETKALKAQIGNTTAGNYSYIDTNSGLIGKYQFSADILASLGFVLLTTTNDTLSSQSNWLNKSGIASKGDFLNSPSIQEISMDYYLSILFSKLESKGLVNESTQSSSAGGMLCVANTLGVNNAVAWTNSPTIQGNNLYKQGRYAIEVLSKVR